jgi:hypothetical protein
MPVEGALNAPAFTAVVTYTLSPQTMGDDQPRPGTSAVHATLSVADQRVGRLEESATPAPFVPRNCGQLPSSAGSEAVAQRQSRSQDGESRMKHVRS